MRFWTIRLLLAGLMVGMLCVGCGSPSSDSSTEDAAARREVPAKAVDQLIRAQQAYRQGAYTAALTLTDSVHRQVSNLPDLHFLRGQIYSALQQHDRARNAYREVLSLDPDYQGAWLNRGISAFENGHFRRALRCYKKERDAYETASVWIEMGRAYQQLSISDSARYSYQRALALDSSRAQAHVRLGRTYEAEGQLERAVRATRTAVRLDSSNLNYRYLLGSQLLQLGRPEEAVDQLRVVVAAQPWHVGAHQSLGQALTLAGREDEGREYLLAVDSLEQMSSRIEDLRSLAGAHPEQPMRWVRLGDALRKGGRLSEAKRAYSIALSHAPGNVALQNNLANLTADLGDTEEAIIRYRTLLRQDSTLADVWLNLGVVYANAGQYANARKAWQRVLRYRPEDRTVRRYIARLDQ